MNYKIIKLLNGGYSIVDSKEGLLLRSDGKPRKWLNKLWLNEFIANNY